VLLGLGEQASAALGDKRPGHVGVGEHIGRSLPVALVGGAACLLRMRP
jgi:hypothetical protein